MVWSLVRQWLGQGPALPEGRDQQPLRQVCWTAVDLELTSLDVKQTEILSVGWVGGQGGCIPLDQSFYQVINADVKLNQSPVIHGLTEETLQQGGALRDVLGALLETADQSIWVFHNTALDMAAITKSCQALGLVMPQVVTLDTLKLAAYHLRKTMDVLPPDSLTLSRCRDRLYLPRAPAHNALDDAMATLQLLFALLTKLAPGQQTLLSDIVHTGALQVFPATAPKEE